MTQPLFQEASKLLSIHDLTMTAPQRRLSDSFVKSILDRYGIDYLQENVPRLKEQLTGLLTKLGPPMQTLKRQQPPKVQASPQKTSSSQPPKNPDQKST